MSTSPLSYECSLEDLGMAYRKAKVDLFYSSRACRRELSEYESDLHANLERLRGRLLSGKAPSVAGDSWTLVPKKMVIPGDSEGSAGGAGILRSSSSKQWKDLCAATPERPIAEFRLMEALSIDCHVFAMLWIQEVGHKFDEKLTAVARGNRLRRDRNGRLNPLSLGMTEKYLRPYSKWRDDGMSAIRRSLDEDQAVVALTTDIRAFFHSLDASFLLDEEFLASVMAVDLSEAERGLHRLFVESLVEWAKNTPIGRGLPVGLAASSLVANVALVELDRMVEREVAPIYYGRYVDDIILVMRDTPGFARLDEVWKWLCKRSGGALKTSGVGNGRRSKARSRRGRDLTVRYSQKYLSGSDIEFAADKTKVFALSGPSGKAMLSSVERQIRARTSEWRSLPDIPSDAADIESDLLTAIKADGDQSDGLSNTDGLSVRRASVALRVRDMEAYCRACPPEAWSARRHGFLDSFIQHVLVLPRFFDFYNYLSRVIELATSCGDFAHLRRIVAALQQVLSDIGACEVVISGSGAEAGASSELNDIDRVLGQLDIHAVFRDQVRSRVVQAVQSAFPRRVSTAQRKAWVDSFGVTEYGLLSECSIKALQETHHEYLCCDLASRPVKYLLLPKELVGGVEWRVPKKSLKFFDSDSASLLLRDAVVEGVKVVSRIARLPVSEGFVSGLLFPTRPPNLSELYLAHQEPFTANGAKEIEACLLAFRGFTPDGKLPGAGDSGKGAPIDVPLGRGSRHKVLVAVASWKTAPRSWVASVTRSADPDGARLERLNRLVNSVLGSSPRPDYLILPELSVPAHWFVAIAHKLGTKGIGLVGGVEYLHAPRSTVRSQVWASLSCDAIGFRVTMIYRQDKQRPALHEELELRRVGGRVLRPRPKARWSEPPVLNHGGFYFSILVCSELSNIRYRSALRGNVDALFVPEWNQDTESFNALVESSAMDVHAYIIQCNDREYGDSRIRVPRKKAWERDIIRVKGGVADYFVVGEIDIEALREFQSSDRSPQNPFKPVPDGFRISHQRRTLPKPNSSDTA